MAATLAAISLPNPPSKIGEKLIFYLQLVITTTTTTTKDINIII